MDEYDKRLIAALDGIKANLDDVGCALWLIFLVLCALALVTCS